ncbi:MAG: glycosyltransferase, partial [Anaerolineales bacterium]
IEQKPIGKNAAVNQGITAATGELLVFLDADSRVEPDWLRELVRPLGASAQATTGSILPLRSTPISAGIQMEYIAAQEIDQANNLFGAGSIALQRSIIQQMGGLPEEVSVGVDWDLNIHLASQQICRAYCKRAIVHTELPASIQDFWRNELRWRRAHLSSIQRFPDYFFSDPAKVIDHIYIYILAWAAVAATLGVVILVLITGGHLAVQTLVPWAAMAAWVLLRRAALAAEVAAYTRDLAWLRWVWVPPLLLVVTLAAIIPASLSISKQNIHFKGPRTARSSQSRGISQ